MARPGGRYARTLELLRRARARARPASRPSRGIMLGLGEERDELLATHARICGRPTCDILTLGQYCGPSAQHLPVARYYHPDEFARAERAARELGFAHVESGPLVRCSYHAKKQIRSSAWRGAAEAAERMMTMDYVPILMVFAVAAVVAGALLGIPLADRAQARLRRSSRSRSSAARTR